MIELRDLTVRFGTQTVLQTQSLSLTPGEHVALMGPSGCGKTTLLRCAAKLQTPQSGSVITRGRAAVLFQEPRLLPWLTAAENVAFVLPHGTDPGLPAQWLERLELASAMDKYPAELSGGMQQRLALARLLAAEADIWLLDEPLQGLDEALSDRLLALLREYSRGKTLLLATHDPRQAELLASRTLHCQGNRFL